MAATNAAAQGLMTIEQFIKNASQFRKKAEEISMTEGGDHQGQQTDSPTKRDEAEVGEVEKTTLGDHSEQEEKELKKHLKGLAVSVKESNQRKLADDVSLAAGPVVKPVLGLNDAKLTGEDPQNETERAEKGKPIDTQVGGDSQHPARSDNDSLDGHKYSSVSTAMLLKNLEKLGNAICQHITNSAVQGYYPNLASSLDQANQPATQQDIEEGWKLASAAHTVMTYMIKDAVQSADLVADYLDAQNAANQRAAAENQAAAMMAATHNNNTDANVKAQEAVLLQQIAQELEESNGDIPPEELAALIQMLENQENSEDDESAATDSGSKTAQAKTQEKKNKQASVQDVLKELLANAKAS